MFKVSRDKSDEKSATSIQNESGEFRVMLEHVSDIISDVWIYDDSNDLIKSSIHLDSTGVVIEQFKFLYDSGILVEDYYYKRGVLMRHGQYIVDKAGEREQEIQMDSNGDTVYIVKYDADRNMRYFDAHGHLLDGPIEFWKGS